MECAARILHQVKQLPASCASLPEEATELCKRKQLVHLYALARLAALRARGPCSEWEAGVRSKLACREHEPIFKCLHRSLVRSAHATKTKEYVRANRIAVEGILRDDKRREGSAMRDVDVASVVDSALGAALRSPTSFVGVYPDTLKHAQNYTNGDVVGMDYELLALCHDYFRETVPTHTGWCACARYYLDREGEPIVALQTYFRECFAKTSPNGALA